MYLKIELDKSFSNLKTDFHLKKVIVVDMDKKAMHFLRKKCNQEDWKLKWSLLLGNIYLKNSGSNHCEKSYFDTQNLNHKMTMNNLVVLGIYLFNYQCEARMIHHLLPSDPYKQYACK